MTKNHMDEARIRQIIREELATLLGADKFVFQKHVQLFDGRNIQTGRTTGTKIGTAADQKLGFFGVTPVAQQSAPTTLAHVITILHNVGLSA
jgi:hypothetical protein